MLDVAGSCSEENTKPIFRQLFKGVVYLHSNAHCGIKLEVRDQPLAGGKRGSVEVL